MRTGPIISTLLLVLLAASGCTHRYTTDASVSLDLPGTVGVEVDNFAGDVVIRVDPDISQPTLTVIRESIHGAGRKEDAKASLSEITYDFEVVTGDLGPVLRVSTATTHAEPHFVRANVVLDLPEVYGVNVRTHLGSVEAFHVQGPIDIETDGADVLVATTRPLLDPITIVNRQGDINMRLRSESSGDLDFATVRGTVTSRITRGRTIIYPPSGADVYRASLNDGRNRVILRTVDGEIRFMVVENPMSYGARLDL